MKNDEMTNDEKVNKMNITLEMLRDYEVIRRSGVTNMFNFYNVIRVAKRAKIKTIDFIEFTKNLLQKYF